MLNTFWWQLYSLVRWLFNLQYIWSSINFFTAIKISQYNLLKRQINLLFLLSSNFACTAMSPFHGHKTKRDVAIAYRKSRERWHYRECDESRTICVSFSFLCSRGMAELNKDWRFDMITFVPLLTYRYYIYIDYLYFFSMIV